MTSEVARIRQHIEDEMRAMQLCMKGFSMSAQHQIITNRFRAIENYTQELETYVGTEQATEITCSIYVQIMG